MKWVVLSDGRTTVPSAFSATGEPFSDRPGLTLVLDIEIDRWGRPRCVGLTMRPAEGGSLNWEPLKKLPLDRLVLQATQVAASFFGSPQPTTDGGLRFDFYGTPEERIAAAEKVADTARRRPKLPDDHLERVARVYREALEAGVAPTRAVAVELAGGWDRYSSAKRWVQQARKAGFLPPTVPGRKAA
jgi:hypothetical protein